LNDLYITDYCVWIQGARDDLVVACAKAIKEISQATLEAQIGLNLKELELTASLATLEVDEIEPNVKCSSGNEVQLDSDDECIG